MRMIDKDALLADIEKTIAESGCVNHEGEIVDCIEYAPAVDAVPVVRGEWIQKHHIISLNNMTLTGTYPTCNLCDYAEVGMAKNTNYCPNCGAKMEDRPCG
ncbi:MAG: hypothetical protein GX117_05010 [Candidatus Hydrogenedentes bacterium]|nr:hypothetical protein [Candidatus Hydrogenedentota bacterium]